MHDVPKIALLLMTALAASVLAPQATGQRAAPAYAPGPVTPPPPPYAQVADLTLRSPMIIDATINRTEKLKGAEAVGAPVGQVRLYVQANVNALVRGTESVPARIGYILDVTPDARGRLPKLRKARVLIYARKAPGYPGQVQLTGPDSQREWTPGLDALTRRIAKEALAADAPPIVTGVGNAFHVPGSLPGEGETQIFLTTRDGRPVSLSIIRRPGERARWAVALSEIVDEAAAPPQPDSLLWYRLACALPADLPAEAMRNVDGSNASVARADYRFVMQSLGPCRR